MPIHTPLIHLVFRFESHWPTTPVFHECVLHTSTKAIPHNQNPMSVLHIKLSRIAKDLKKWSKAQIPPYQNSYDYLQGSNKSIRKGARKKNHHNI
jgi:hypothetical protein